MRLQKKRNPVADIAATHFFTLQLQQESTQADVGTSRTQHTIPDVTGKIA